MIIVRSRTSIGDIRIPAVLRIKHEVRAQISAYPLEDGAEVADHVRVLPQGVELLGIITPTDQSLLGQITSAGAPAALVAGTHGELDIEGWQDLKALIRARKRLEIVTRYDTYFVLPLELMADEDAGFGLALQFTMRFVQVETGSVRSLDQIAVDLRDNIGGKVGTDNLGRQQLGPEEDVPAALAKSKPRVVNPWTAAAV